MHEENTRSTRHSYRASRVPKTQLNVAIENVGKIPRICGGGGGGITAASSGSSGDKEDENYNFFHNGDDIGNDIGGFGDTNNADESVVLDGCNNEFNVVNNDDDLVDDEVPEFLEASVPDFNFADVLSSLIKKVEDSEAREDQVEDVGEIRERLHEDDNISTSTVQQLAEDLNNLFSLYGTSKQLINDIFGVLAKNIPGINWPCSTNSKIVRNENEVISVRSNLKAYVSEDIRSIDVDVCGNGCCAFLGSSYHMIRCPTCKKERFHPCSICQSKGMKSYDECNHKNRKSRCGFQYRYYLTLL